MTVDMAYFALMYVSLGFMLLQIFVKEKKLVHLFFAIFCGSMAMVAAQELSSETLGPFKYLFGLGACATCNGMWLLSKTLFSGESSVSLRHILFALSIALLIVINNILNMAFEFSALEFTTFQQLGIGLREIINLLSSTVLALTCWEALNGLFNKTKHEFWQRVLFISSFCLGVTLCIVFANVFYTADELPQVYPWFMSFSAIQIIIVTQIILWWKNYIQLNSPDELTESEVPDIDPKLISGINSVLKENKGYLTQNLKIVDLAHELKVSEYKISRAIRHHFDAPNFNYFINSLRIEHAKELLSQSETQHWPIVVIALESGFSSLATFNRVFKAQSGYAPNKHRKNLAPL